MCDINLTPNYGYLRLNPPSKNIFNAKPGLLKSLRFLDCTLHTAHLLCIIWLRFALNMQILISPDMQTTFFPLCKIPIEEKENKKIITPSHLPHPSLLPRVWLWLHLSPELAVPLLLPSWLCTVSHLSNRMLQSLDTFPNAPTLPAQLKCPQLACWVTSVRWHGCFCSSSSVGNKLLQHSISAWERG